MNHKTPSKIFQLSEEEKEFIHAMKEKNESITSDRIDEAIAWARHCLENDDVDEAMRFSIAAAAMSKYLNDFPRLIKSAMQRGEILAYNGQYEETIEQCQDVLKILKRSIPISGFCKDKEAEAICYANIGELYNVLGMVEKAKENLHKSVTITDAFVIPDLARSNHIELGSIYLDTGYIENALHHFEKALSFSNPDEEGYIDILLNMANAYADIGFTDKAHIILNEAFSVCELHGSVADEYRLHTNKGYLFTQDKAWEKALVHFEKALHIARETDDREGEAILLTDIGNVLAAQNDNEAAVDYYTKSLAIHEEYDNKEAQAVAHCGLGDIAAENKDYAEALTHYTTAETLFQDLGFLPQVQLVYKYMGLLYEQSHDIIKAVEMYEKSIDLLEKIRNFSQREEIQIRFTGEREDVYGCIVGALLELNDVERIFQYIEKAKAYTLETLLEKKHVFSDHYDADLATYQNLKIECNILYSRKLRYVTWPDTLEQQLTRTQQLLTEMEEKVHSKYAEIDSSEVDTLNIKCIEEMLEDSTIIEYYVFIDAVCAVIVGKNVREVITIEFTPEFIKKFEREKFIEKFMEKKWSLAHDVLEFYNTLFSPLEQYLKEDQHICIVPHGILHYIPIHALFDGEKFLIEKYKISYSPSVAVLKFCMEREIDNHQYFIAGGGNRFTEKEALEVATLFNAEVSEFSREVFKKNCNNKSIIHLACHGVFLQRDPLSSYIMFQDGELDAGSIFNLNLQADLVTLSACETGVNQVAGGDELLGLERAFLFAGAKSLLHSLWPVSGSSTNELMLKFYKNLKNGQSKLDSLRNAQLDLVHNSRFASPFYWAPFVLVGDWH